MNTPNQEENHKVALDNFKDLLDNMDNKIYGGYTNTQQNSSNGFYRMGKEDMKYRTLNTDRGEN